MNTYFNLGCLKCPNFDKEKSGKCIISRGAPCKVVAIAKEEMATIMAVVDDFKSFCKMANDGRPNCPVADKIIACNVAENNADACRMCREIWFRVHLSDFLRVQGVSQKTNKQLTYASNLNELFK